MFINPSCIPVTDENFQSEVIVSQIPVLVDCWASWCGSFHHINPIVEELAIAFDKKIKVVRLNVATSETIAARYGIRVVPTLLFFNQEVIVERIIGSASKQDLVHKLNDLILNSYSNRSCIACL